MHDYVKSPLPTVSDASLALPFRPGCRGRILRRAAKAAENEIVTAIARC